MARKPKNKREIAKIAKERILQLFDQAGKAWPQKDKANRYVEMARKIAMKHQIRMPKVLKRKFCKHCYCFLVPSENLRVRTKDGKVVYTCLECKKFMRFPYK